MFGAWHWKMAFFCKIFYTTHVKCAKNEKRNDKITFSTAHIWKIDHLWSFNFQICSSHHNICDALRNLVPFVQFKKREIHPWRCVTFRKVAGYDVFHFFWILQMVTNRVIHQKYISYFPISVIMGTEEVLSYKFENM